MTGETQTTMQDVQFLPTIVVVSFDNFGGLIQPVLIKLLLGEFMPESCIQGATERSKLQLGDSRIHWMVHLTTGSCHGFS